MKGVGRVIAIVPARGGSKGLPRKNILPLAGKPLICHTVEAALQETILDQVIVSTDDLEIADAVRSYDVDVVMRPAEYATDESPIDPTLRHALRWSEDNFGPVSVAVWLQANVPHRKVGAITKAVKKLIDSECTSVVSVVPYRVPPQWAWRLEGDRMYRLEGCHAYTVRRQDAVAAFHLTGAYLVMRRDILLGTEGQPPASFLGSDIRALVEPEEFSIEVDEPFDLLLCEFIMERMKLSVQPKRESDDDGYQ